MALRWPIVVLALTLLSIGMRIQQWSEPLWIDELHTSWTIDGSWQELIPRASAGNQPPLYFCFEKGLLLNGPQTTTRLRILSMLSGLGVVIAVAEGARRLTGSELAGFASGMLLAIDPDAVFFSVEARPYGLLMLVTALNLLVSATQLQRLSLAHVGPPDSNSTTASSHRRIHGLSSRISWVLTAGLMVHLHYIAALFLVVEFAVFVIVLAWIGKGQKHWIPKLATDVGLVLLMCLPLFAGLADVGSRRQAWSTFVDGSLSQSWPTLRLIGISIGVPVVLWGFDGILGKSIRRWATSRGATIIRRPLTVAKTTVFFLTLGCLALALTAFALTRLEIAPVLLTRYLLQLWPMAALACGCLVGRIQGPWLRLFCALGIAMLACQQRDVKYWFYQGESPPGRVESWDQAVRWIEETEQELPASSEWQILLVAGLIEDQQLWQEPSEDLKAYLRFPLSGIYAVSDADQRIRPAATSPKLGWEDDIVSTAARSGGLWVIVRDHPTHPVLLDRVLRRVTEQLNQLEGEYTVDYEAFGAIHVSRIRRLGS